MGVQKSRNRGVSERALRSLAVLHLRGSAVEGQLLRKEQFSRMEDACTSSPSPHSFPELRSLEKQTQLSGALSVLKAILNSTLSRAERHLGPGILTDPGECFQSTWTSSFYSFLPQRPCLHHLSIPVASWRVWCAPEDRGVVFVTHLPGRGQVNQSRASQHPGPRAPESRGACYNADHDAAVAPVCTR